MRQRVFIGSSSESLEIARAIEANLSKDHEPTVWDEGIFELSKDTLSGLLDRLDASDAAVFVLAPDDVLMLRNQKFDTARDNVVFELGLFIGRLGRDRTYFVVPRNHETLRLPSDLLGLVAADYDDARSDGNWDAAVSPACTRINSAIKKSQMRESQRALRHDPLVDGLSWMQRYVNKALLSFVTSSELPSLAECKIERSVEGDYCTQLGRTNLRIRFGDIRTCDPVERGTVVALPANEFFEDDCVNDPGSALGSYIQHAFPEQTSDIQRLIARKLQNVPSEIVESEPGTLSRSYGVAHCVYLENALSTGRKMILVSITTKRSGFGLRCEARYLFAAMKSICREMNDRRLTDLSLPVMGSGHGGLEPEIALLYLLLSIGAVIHDGTGGAHLRSVTVIVFQGSNRVPAIHPELVERMLRVAKHVA
jgi:hypothetical protein